MPKGILLFFLGALKTQKNQFDRVARTDEERWLAGVGRFANCFTNSPLQATTTCFKSASKSSVEWRMFSALYFRPSRFLMQIIDDLVDQKG
jgi:hypothetical protein